MTAISLGSWNADRGHRARGRAGTEHFVSIPENGSGPVDLSEAARQLELAIHDARVSFDCIALEDLDRAHISAITARAALDAAETLLRAALATTPNPNPAP
jgi:hypothetical protein